MVPEPHFSFFFYLFSFLEALVPRVEQCKRDDDPLHFSCRSKRLPVRYKVNGVSDLLLY